MSNHNQEADEKLAEKRTKMFDGILAGINFLGGIGGALALSIVILKGGVYMERQDAMGVRVSSLEAYAAPVTQAHFKVDEARDADVLRRLAILERAFQEISDIKTDLRVNNVKLDAVKASVERLEAKRVN